MGQQHTSNVTTQTNRKPPAVAKWHLAAKIMIGHHNETDRKFAESLTKFFLI